MSDLQRDTATQRALQWFTSRIGSAMAAKVFVGDDWDYIATGPLIGVEEHPDSPGVYRAVFDDSMTGGVGATRFVAFGAELQDVVAGPSTLVLDKGEKRIEIVDRTVPAEPSAQRSDEVDWPQKAQSVSALPFPAPPSPPVPAPGAATVPPPPREAVDPRAGLADVTADIAQQMELSAPLYDNALAQRVSGGRDC